MEKLSAIFQISILLIVAFLIGIVMTWVYWRIKYRKLKDETEEKAREQERLRMELQQSIDRVNTENQELKEQLEESREKNILLMKEYIPSKLYTAIVKNMGEGVSVSDENGFFLVYNPKLEQITGYTREEANEQKDKIFLKSIYPDEDLRQKVAEDIENIPEAKEHTNIKSTITTKDNKKVPVLVTSTVVSYYGKKYYLSVFRDVSKEPKVEA
ncbi:MAG: PAS domain S-box protein [Bacteroidota bacterium]